MAAFFRGKTVGFSIKSKVRKAKKLTQKQQKTKEGLGLSEMALWATSPDP